MTKQELHEDLAECIPCNDLEIIHYTRRKHQESCYSVINFRK